MRHKVALLALFLSMCITTGATSGFSAGNGILPNAATDVPMSTNSGLLKLKIKELEKLAGRKFSLKEKWKILLLKRSLKRKSRKLSGGNADPDVQATWSFIAGLLVVGLLVPGLFNLITGASFLFIIPVLGLVALWLGWRSARSGKNFKNMFGIIAGGVVLLAGAVVGIIALISGVI